MCTAAGRHRRDLHGDRAPVYTGERVLGRRRGRVLPTAHEPRGLCAPEAPVRELAGWLCEGYSVTEVTRSGRPCCSKVGWCRLFLDIDTRSLLVPCSWRLIPALRDIARRRPAHSDDCGRARTTCSAFRIPSHLQFFSPLPYLARNYLLVDALS